MKKLILSILFGAAGLFYAAAEEAADAVSVILNSFGAMNYSAGAIPKADLEKIVAAGIRAPSASNKQPWHFTVVSTPALTAKLMSGLPEGNIFIVVSADSNNRDSFFDCALAVENIYLAAQALGYGSRIYAGPVSKINGGLKKELGIPAERAVVTVVRVGRIAKSADAATSASPRKPTDTVVTYK
jgi:nitroreductase